MWNKTIAKGSQWSRQATVPRKHQRGMAVTNQGILPLSKLHSYPVRKFSPPACTYKNLQPPRKQLELSLELLSRGRHEIPVRVSKHLIRTMKTNKTQQKSQDGLRNEDYFSTPANYRQRSSFSLGENLTHEIQAPLSRPKAISHAGSRD